MVLRIAVWSTPRTTVPFLLRALDARRDTFVSDEPFAGLSVAHSRRLRRAPEGPGSAAEPFDADRRDEWRAVATRLSGRAPLHSDIWVQKHVAPQLLPHVERDWLRSFRHVFLLGSPRTLIARAIGSGSRPRIEDTSLPHQLEIFRWVEQHATTDPIVVCDDLCATESATMLPEICGSLGILFDSAMLEPAPGLYGCGGSFYDGDSQVGIDSIPLEYEGLLTRCEAMVNEMRDAGSRVYC